MDIYGFKVKDIEGKERSLDTFRGKVMVIVNVASKCGYTSQYEGLETLYKKYKERGLVVLGFPCNQFGGQEPGTEAEIQGFCETKFHVTFPLFAKIAVNGSNTDPLYDYLKKEEPGLLGTQAIKWNFTKFLVDRSGKVKKRFAPQATPEAMDSEIGALL